MKKNHKTVAALVVMLVSLVAVPAQAMTVSANSNAAALANLFGGNGVSITNATLSTASSTAAGTFTGAASAIGFDSGLLLTTGTVDCAVGPNTVANCYGTGQTTSLAFDFESASGNLFFNYVFASEEYPEFVGTRFNDSFELLLNGVNIALLPDMTTVVAINNINSDKNAQYYRSNSDGSLDTQYDGLTTVLTAQATGLTGVNHFELRIADVGDAIFDSGVFLQAGTFSATPSAPLSDVPEPASLALIGLGVAGIAAARRKRAMSKAA
ncbi:MAG: choice-of-anchor L domain-containing protein [Janthinobacterium lividum]